MNNPIASIKCASPVGDVCGEAVVWDDMHRVVYWTDINRFLIHRYCPATHTTETWLFEEPVTALALSEDPRLLLVALASRLIWWSPDTDERLDHGFRLRDYPAIRFNDGRADPLGNFWVGTMRNNVTGDGETVEIDARDGALYRISPEGEVTTWATGLGIPNTLCWSPDRRVFYTGDSMTGEIFAYDFDPRSAELGKKRVHLAKVEPGIPDGSAIDSDGFIWNCRYAGGAILRLSPDGCVDRVIEMPCSSVTTATFGGPHLQALYVTSACATRAKGDRLAGSLWVIETSVVGLPENRVKPPQRMGAAGEAAGAD
jgi:sugar lactone lactonase YvrE